MSELCRFLILCVKPESGRTVASIVISELQRDRISAVLGRRNTNRDIASALDEGVSQADISERLGMSETEVSRVAQSIRIYPESIVRSPGDVIHERALGYLSDDQMMTELLDWAYTFAQRPHDGYADGSIPGTWDDVVDGYFGHLITREELPMLRDRVKPPR